MHKALVLIGLVLIQLVMIALMLMPLVLISMVLIVLVLIALVLITLVLIALALITLVLIELVMIALVLACIVETLPEAQRIHGIESIFWSKSFSWNSSKLISVVLFELVAGLATRWWDMSPSPCPLQM